MKAKRKFTFKWLWELVVQFPGWATLILTTGFGATFFASIGAIFKFFETKLAVPYFWISIVGTLLLSESALIVYFLLKQKNKTPAHLDWWTVTDPGLKFSWQVISPSVWLNTDIRAYGPNISNLVKGPFHAVPGCSEELASRLPVSFQDQRPQTPFDPAQITPMCPNCKEDITSVFKSLAERSVTARIVDINSHVLLQLQRLNRAGVKLRNGMEVKIFDSPTA